MNYQLKESKRYRKDLKRLRQANVDLSPLNQVINLLVNGELLPEMYHDHKLKGDLSGYRACHIAPDWLLLYERDDEFLYILCLQTGDHRQVLGIE